MSLFDVVTDLCDVTEYWVRRTGTGSWVKGRYTTDGVQPSRFRITAGIVPTGTGLTLQDPPESQYSEEDRQIFTNVPLAPRTPTQEPDFVEIDGEDWLVTSCARWQGLGETIYVCHATRYAVP